MKSKVIFLSCFFLIIPFGINASNNTDISIQEIKCLLPKDWDHLVSLSAPEMREYILKKGIVIENDSYLDMVLAACESIDILFRDSNLSIKQILNSYEAILAQNNSNNEFILNINNYYQNLNIANAKKLFGENCKCLGTPECPHKDTHAFIGLCFLEYIHNPFTDNQNMLKKNTRIIRSVLNSDKKFINTGSEIILINLNKSYLYGKGGNIGETNHKFKDNGIEIEFDEQKTKGESLFEELCHEHNVCSLYKKAGLYNLFRHSIHPSFQKKLLDEKKNKNERDDIKRYYQERFTIAYKYVLKPLVTILIKTEKCDHNLLRKATHYCIRNSSLDDLNALNLFAIKLLNGNYSEHIKETIQLNLLQPITMITSGDHSLKSRKFFWRIDQEDDLYDDILSFNGLMNDTTLDSEFRLLKITDSNYRNLFNKKHGFTEEILSNNNVIFDEIDTYVKEHLINDPVENAEILYRNSEMSWLKKISMLIFSATQELGPQIFEMINNDEESAEKKLDIKMRSLQYTEQRQHLESTANQLTTIYGDNAANVLFSQKKLADESQKNFLRIQAKRDSVRQIGA